MELPKKIKRNNNPLLTMADQVNTIVVIVVMDKGDYTKKVESYIMKNGYQLMDKDPTEEYKTRIKDVMKENSRNKNMFHVPLDRPPGLCGKYEEI